MAHEEPDDSEFQEPDVDDGSDEMWWETKARQAIQGYLDDLEYDEISGVIYTRDSHGGRADQFDSVEDLLNVLTDIGDEEWTANAPWDNGPVFESDAEGIAEELVDNLGINAFFERIKPPEEGDELATARDLLLPKAGLIVRGDLSEINDELIKYLAKHPEMLHNMEPRKFEELVAALFRAKGYDVELTPATRDGGFDMRAFHRSDVGTLLTLIECKRYAPERRVAVDVVRGLYGVTESERATTGLIVTTSSFTTDAQSFQAQHQHRITLANQTDLRRWLNEHNAR